MQPQEFFEHCPHCGKPRTPNAPRQPFTCLQCGFHYYFNPCLAVAALLLGPDERALLIRRAHEPARGRLAFPGGFVDIGETAEAALRREIREEVNLEVGPLEFLGSYPNEYLFRDVTYPVLDLVFLARAKEIQSVAALDGVESFVWRSPTEMDPAELAFPSLRNAWQAYCQSGRLGT